MNSLYEGLSSLGDLSWRTAVPFTVMIILTLAAIAAIIVFMSFWNIGPTEVGLVRKRFGLKRNRSGSPVALNGEAGYQADLLMTGQRFKLWPPPTVRRPSPLT